MKPFFVSEVIHGLTQQDCASQSHLKHKTNTGYESQLNMRDHEPIVIEIDPQKTKWYLFENQSTDYAFFFFNFIILKKIFKLFF